MTEDRLKDELRRAGLSDDLARSYLLALTRPDAVGDDDGGRLVAAGMAERDARGVLHLFAPAVVLDARAQEMESRARALRHLGPELDSLYRRSNESGPPAVQYLRTPQAATEAFLRIFQQARTSIRALDRGPHRRPLAPSPAPEQLAAMQAGVSVRVVYAARVIAESDVRRDIYSAIAAGEKARVLPELPMRMVLADETSGLVTRVLPDNQLESFVVGPSLMLETLIGLFETLWDLAIPLRPTQSTDDPDEEVTMVLRGLAAGLTDDAIARELGVSERTVARRIARLQEMYATRSRFQLGYQAARRDLI